MHSCTVNGAEYRATQGLKTWGELLNALEQGEGPARAIVTAVRFGGVDQPSFREPAALARDLRFAAPIDVESCAAADLITAAVTTALDGLAPITDAARATADLFRQHELPRAHASLGELVNTLQTLARLTAAVSHAHRSSQEWPLENESAKFLNQLGTSLESLIAAAMGEDWISVADVLEYEIAEELPRWREVLAANEQSNLRLRYAS